jgi:hypothetical protein
VSCILNERSDARNEGGLLAQDGGAAGSIWLSLVLEGKIYITITSQFFNVRSFSALGAMEAKRLPGSEAAL